MDTMRRGGFRDNADTQDIVAIFSRLPSEMDIKVTGCTRFLEYEERFIGFYLLYLFSA
jgi:hypothetical protein